MAKIAGSGSGSTTKCNGSGTLLETLQKMLVLSWPEGGRDSIYVLHEFLSVQAGEEKYSHLDPAEVGKVEKAITEKTEWYNR
jgi:hypothetical protein